jgi:predicted phosphodiesterase
MCMATCLTCPRRYARAVEAEGVDEIWCLGDLVGYGAKPIETVELVRERAALAVAGNHDRAAAGQEPLYFFPPWLQAQLVATKRRLATNNLLEWVTALPNSVGHE